jgi:hypothetical protein
MWRGMMILVAGATGHMGFAVPPSGTAPEQASLNLPYPDGYASCIVVVDHTWSWLILGEPSFQSCDRTNILRTGNSATRYRCATYPQMPFGANNMMTIASAPSKIRYQVPKSAR